MDEKNAGACYTEGMAWRGITLTTLEAASLNQYDRDISKAVSPDAKSWLMQNKAEFMALLLGIEVANVG
ncbi:hypothetical protein AM391_RS23600 [Kluyvera ascorbata]|nr:hypothetical protein [Kluyvera ascorbata]